MVILVRLIAVQIFLVFRSILDHEDHEQVIQSQLVKIVLFPKIEDNARSMILSICTASKLRILVHGR